ncbi:MAG: DUF2085 domain-containing protein [Candidatus Altiarchaeota archaeon]
MEQAKIIFLLVSLMLFALIISAPYLAYTGDDVGSGFNYRIFAGFCHQKAERSFLIFGYKMGVCARCFGIYAGMLIGALLYPLRGCQSRMPNHWIILAALVPLTLDGGSQLLGLRESTNTLRFATGLIFGLTLPYYLIPALDGLLTYMRPRR